MWEKGGNNIGISQLLEACALADPKVYAYVTLFKQDSGDFWVYLLTVHSLQNWYLNNCYVNQYV